MPRITLKKTQQQRAREPSKKVREQIEAAWGLQHTLFENTGLHIYANMGASEILQFMVR